MSIILTCRNNVQLSKLCLETLLAQTDPFTPRILLINNASTDGTSAWARGEQMKDRRVFVASFEEPMSVAHMWNLGLRFMWGNGLKQALVVNNDTELLPETYATLSAYLEIHRDVGMATCVSVRERERMVMPVHLPPPTSNPDYSCFMLTRWAHERVRFDEQCIGAFCEDNIHHVDLHRAGIPAHNIGVPFLHHGSSTIKTADPLERGRIERNAAHNREYFFSRYGCYPGTVAYGKLFC